jgi:5-methylcytosine-specific restriction protein B
MVNVTGLSDERLDALIESAERLRRTAETVYRQAVEERNRRQGGGLDLAISIKAILHAARAGRFLSYGELAAANGADWGAVRYPMNTHLGEIIRYARHRGWPMLSAVVVNKKNLDSGKMEPTTLKGFIEAAKWLGYDVDDQEDFLDRQQKECFKWARVVSESDSAAASHSPKDQARG